ncbi:DUF6146 family protein [Lutibacter sp.]
MRTLIYFLAISLFIFSCSSTTKTITTNNSKLPEEAVIIANDSLEYEITIIDLGFKLYLNTIAKPANYYSQKYYETKNQFYVTRWNIRAQNPLRYDDSIYENIIDYDFNTDYGLDVNYKLYNYFKFVEYKYHQVF